MKVTAKLSIVIFLYAAINRRHIFEYLLIGGIPGVGKTSISGYIARQLNINIVMSGD